MRIGIRFVSLPERHRVSDELVMEMQGSAWKKSGTQVSQAGKKREVVVGVVPVLVGWLLLERAGRGGNRGWVGKKSDLGPHHPVGPRARR